MVSRDGITIEADQRHVREMLKDLDLEQANHAAPPWDDAGDGDDKNTVQMTNDELGDANDIQALTGGDIMKYRALVARISYLSQERPDLKFAAMQVCCAMANPSASAGNRVVKYSDADC